jgi:predicted RNase H-like HicB family nuclease
MAIGTFTAVLHNEGNLYVAACPEVGTVSQGKSPEERLRTSKKLPSFTSKFFPPRKIA